MMQVSQNFSDSSRQRMSLVQMFRNFTFVITLASGASYSRMMTADIMRCDSCPDSIHVYPFVKFRACVSPKLQIASTYILFNILTVWGVTFFFSRGRPDCIDGAVWPCKLQSWPTISSFCLIVFHDSLPESQFDGNFNLLQ